MCNTKISVGAFGPDLQCEWKGPVASDPVPLSSHVLVSPLVADLPVTSGSAAEIIVVTTEKPAGSDMADGQSAAAGVTRLREGRKCQPAEDRPLAPRLLETPAPPLAHPAHHP